jgi:hypothetical protein
MKSNNPNITIVDLDRESQDTAAFAIKIGRPIAERPTLPSVELCNGFKRHLYEELSELDDAMRAGDLVNVADALVDIVYIAKHMGAVAGLPWAELWDEVQRTNMLKEPGEQGSHKFGVVKPVGWRPPDIAGILKRHGF